MLVFSLCTYVLSVDYDSDFEDRHDKGKGTATADPYAGTPLSGPSVLNLTRV